MHAIVLAGGKGTRLGAITLHQPKVLVSLDESHTILSVIVQQLRRFGFQRITMCVAHLADQIKEAFGDGARFGIRIDYRDDSVATGTAGPLLGVTDFRAPALVMNGDVLTSLNLAQMYAGHLRSGAVLTVGAVERGVYIEHGVLSTKDQDVMGIVEKPHLIVTVSAGIYVVSPPALAYLSAEVASTMPELVNALIEANLPVRTHPITETWFDIGTPPQLEQARQFFLTQSTLFLGAAQLVGNGHLR